MAISQPIATGPSATATKPVAWYQQLYTQVVIAVVLGIAIGAIFPTFGASLKPLGDAFINLVKMIIAPVIFLTVVTGLGGMSHVNKIGSVFGKALAYFLAVSTFALAIGLVVGNLVQPGAGMNIDPATLDGKLVENYTERAHEQSLLGFVMNIIPKTPISALAEGEILQVLLIAVLTGIAIAAVGEPAQPLLNVLEAANQVVFKLVHMLMKLAPIGAFGAMAFTIGKFGVASLVSLGSLIVTFYVTSLLFVIIVLGLIARLAGFSIFQLVRYIKQELLLVLGTSSSEAALPTLMEKLERAGCRKEVVGIVLPTGYSFNLDGTNIYMTLAATFIAQAVGIDLSLHDQLLLIGVAAISSKGAAGVTGAGFVILAATLSVVPSVPVAGMALILGIDRFMSECRALTNLMGNAVATIVVSHWEGALDKDMLAEALAGAGTQSSDPT
ncbi:dicarboxylate/amino acid:cation symporter [Aquidulcibacter sp.]|uniref:dicarboxylate/amino acid:cation symporter n=1 Tax=Aquidulcibacter sp. TaxID=2052990 RepID=UPI0025BD9697|nr:dicarboxylate/amino acid:cation symporter [Aquidulcibacter sp.]